MERSKNEGRAHIWAKGAQVTAQPQPAVMTSKIRNPALASHSLLFLFRRGNHSLAISETIEAVLI